MASAILSEEDAARRTKEIAGSARQWLQRATSIIHSVDVRIFHLMARLKLGKEHRGDKLALPGAIMGVLPPFDHLVKFVPREGSVRRVARRTKRETAP